jgi:hypothetical protein
MLPPCRDWIMPKASLRDISILSMYCRRSFIPYSSYLK